MPAVDLVERRDMERVEQRLDALERRMDLLLGMLESMGARSYFGIRDICRIINVSESYARKHPEVLPKYGVSDFPDGMRRWKRETVAAYLAKSMSEHVAEWGAMGARERARIRRNS